MQSCEPFTVPSVSLIFLFGKALKSNFLAGEFTNPMTGNKKQTRTNREQFVRSLSMAKHFLKEEEERNPRDFFSTALDSRTRAAE